MKRTKSLKTVAFALGLAAMTMLPQWVSAQDNGGSGTQAWSGKSLFGRDGSGNGYSVSTFDGGSHARSFVSLFGRQNLRGVSGSGSGYSIFVEQFGGENGGGTGGYNISTEQFGAPLGSGLFIMAAAGAAYAFSKKRKQQENN